MKAVYWEVILGGRSERSGRVREGGQVDVRVMFKIADVGWTSEKYMECLLEPSP